jgi:hypothetical protein
MHGGDKLPWFNHQLLHRLIMKLIEYGYDKEHEVWERGIARPDWTLRAIEDPRGHGWQISCLRGARTEYLTREQAIAQLLGV